MKFIHGDYNRIHESDFTHSEVMDTSFGNRYRVILIRAKCFIELDNDPPKTFDKNSLLFVQSGTSFKYGAIENNIFINDWFEFSADTSEVEYLGLYKDLILPEIDDGYAKIFTKKIREMVRESYSNDLHSKEAVNFYLNLFLIELSRYIEMNKYIEQKKEISHPMYSKILAMRTEILTGAFNDEIVIKVCKKYDISESHFRRLYKKLFYRTIAKDILSRKVLVAQKYLTNNNNYSVSEIVYMLGYKNHETFFRQFKRMTGMTPIEYKKRFSKSFYKETNEENA